MRFIILAHLVVFSIKPEVTSFRENDAKMRFSIKYDKNPIPSAIFSMYGMAIEIDFNSVRKEIIVNSACLKGVMDGWTHPLLEMQGRI